MTSLQTSIRAPGADGYFINVGSLVSAWNGTPKISALTNSSTLSTASWSVSTLAAATNPAGSYLSSLLHTPGSAMLRDMGKNVVSSNRTFRKVQLIVNAAQIAVNGGTFSTTNGIGGAAPTPSLGEDYLTGYIELGFDGVGAPAPVARFGR